MKTKEFQLLTAELERMTPHQRRLLADCLHKIEHIQAISALIENRILATPLCPKCGHNQIARWGSASGLQRYRCCACRVIFNTLSGTPLARLRHKDKWLEYAQQIASGQSVRTSAKVCDMHRNTAFRWRHRFLKLPIDSAIKKIYQNSRLLCYEKSNCLMADSIMSRKPQVWLALLKLTKPLLS